MLLAVTAQTQLLKHSVQLGITALLVSLPLLLVLLGHTPQQWGHLQLARVLVVLHVGLGISGKLNALGPLLAYVLAVKFVNQEPTGMDVEA